MATVGAIRDGLKVRLATITGLRTHDVWPDQVNPPAAVVNPVSGNYEQTFSDTQANYVFEIIVVVQAGTLRSAQDALDAYLGTGSGGICAAMLGDVTLAGIVDTLFVRGFRDYGQIEINGAPYLGAVVDVEVVN